VTPFSYAMTVILVTLPSRSYVLQQMRNVYLRTYPYRKAET